MRSTIVNRGHSLSRKEGRSSRSGGPTIYAVDNTIAMGLPIKKSAAQERKGIWDR